MARIAAIILLPFIFLCLHSQAREAPHLTGELRASSVAIEDSDLSRQISLSLRSSIGRRFHRSYWMSTSPTIHLPGGCHHGLVPLRMYQLGPAIPIDNFRQIVGDLAFGRHGIRGVGLVKIERQEKRGSEGFLSGFWSSLKSAFQDFYG